MLDGFHDFGALAAFGQADNLAAPLRVQVAPGAALGQRITVTADLAYEGFVESHALPRGRDAASSSAVITR